ncbi:histidine phosphatase family protein [Streptomyces syringium]|uniref:histidine phosphatase family protein n=1 Tax=Streptomyces syringium TaxID=76729 RepID=UPI003650B0FA
MLYLVRHGEAASEESGLTEAGRRQAVLIGERLWDTPLAVVHHGPLSRAEQTARLIGDQLKTVPLRVSAAAGDRIPPRGARLNAPAMSAHEVTARREQVRQTASAERTGAASPR